MAVPRPMSAPPSAAGAGVNAVQSIVIVKASPA
jgi:hypothetical protein